MEEQARSRSASSTRSLPNAFFFSLSSQLVSAHAGEAEQSVRGLKICFAAGDGNSRAREKMKPVGICTSLSPSLLACHSFISKRKAAFVLTYLESTSGRD